MFLVIITYMCYFLSFLFFIFVFDESFIFFVTSFTYVLEIWVRYTNSYFYFLSLSKIVRNPVPS